MAALREAPASRFDRRGGNQETENKTMVTDIVETQPTPTTVVSSVSLLYS